MLEVIDNFLPDRFVKDIELRLVREPFSWYYYPWTVPSISTESQFIDDNTLDTPHFVHIFCQQNKILSDYYQTVYPLLYYLDPKYEFSNIIRMKANLTTKWSDYPKGKYAIPHVDNYRDSNEIMDIPPAKTLLYYVNDSDGDTIFFNETIDTIKDSQKLTIRHIQSPKKNTAVLFDSNIFHCANPPMSNETRIVINTVFF